MNAKRILITVALLVLACNFNLPAGASTAPVYWIVGPTAVPGTMPQLINDTALNMTNQAMFGTDPGNYTLQGVSLSGIGGGLTAMFGTMGPWIVIGIVAAIGAVIYIGNDQDITPICYLLVISGATTGGGAYAFALPGIYYLVAALMLGLGIASLFYMAFVGEG